MKFCWTTIRAKNMEESLKFYQEVCGLPVVSHITLNPDTQIAFLGDEETKLEIISNAGAEQVDLGKDISIGFEVKSLDEHMAFVKAKGVTVHSGPFQPNPHVRFFYVIDPNGLKVQFVENL